MLHYLSARKAEKHFLPPPQHPGRAALRQHGDGQVGVDARLQREDRGVRHAQVAQAARISAPAAARSHARRAGRVARVAGHVTVAVEGPGDCRGGELEPTRDFDQRSAYTDASENDFVTCATLQHSLPGLAKIQRKAGVAQPGTDIGGRKAGHAGAERQDSRITNPLTRRATFCKSKRRVYIPLFRANDRG